jgi:uncharacterized damage-inducible protein DinB
MRTLFEYNRWANNKVLEACEGLSEEDLRKDFGTSRGSVVTTLHHVVEVEAGWFSRWSETERMPVEEPRSGSEMTDLREAFERVDAAMIEFANGRDDAGLAKTVEFGSPERGMYSAPVWAIMAHGMNHSTQHRAEAGVMMASLGSEPGDVDYLYYADESGFAFQPVSE